LEHTLSVCRSALWVAERYPQLDRDLLIVAAFLHDVGKTRELSATSSIAYTDEGRLLGHLVLGAAMLEEKLGEIKGFPSDLGLRLRHLILSHHGEYAFGSPKRPKFLEAFALHLIDDLDAKINGLGRFMAKDHREGAWTEYNRLFERYLLKGALGDLDDPPAAPGRGDRGQVSLFNQDDGGGVDPER
jgi:3'-5' exoribonuclease